jgi:uncharacterized protein
MRRFILLILGSLYLSNLVAWSSLDFILTRLSTPPLVGWIMAVFFLLQVIGITAMIGGRLLGYQPGTGMGRPLLSFLMIWNMLIALPTAAVSLIGAILVWLMNVQAAPGNPGQIVGWILVALPFAIAVLATLVSLWQLDRFRIHRVKLTIPKLPPALKGFTIAHLSDIHIGKLTCGKVLDNIVAETNRLDADLILLTGDLINMSLEDLPHALNLLRQMKSRYGLFSCEGNHDLIESRREFEASVKASGLRFLLNESATFSVDGQVVQILGLRYGEENIPAEETVGPAPGSALHQLLTQTDPDDFTILLAHHPDAFDAAAQAGIPLTLAGHTHGGQLMLTPTLGFGPWFFRYWSGIYEKGLSRMIVSNGTGNWFPLRIQAPAEIIHLTLD